MKPLGECMSIFCSNPAFSKCPFCPVKYCEKHGTKTKWDAWPKEKFGNRTPFQYWPCAICDRKLKDHPEFGNLGENDYNDLLIEVFSHCTQEELEHGIGSIKKPSKMTHSLPKVVPKPTFSNVPSSKREVSSSVKPTLFKGQPVKMNNKLPPAGQRPHGKPPVGKFCTGCGKSLSTSYRVASNMGNRVVGGMIGSVIAGPIGGLIGSRMAVKSNASNRKCMNCL